MSTEVNDFAVRTAVEEMTQAGYFYVPSEGDRQYFPGKRYGGIGLWRTIYDIAVRRFTEGLECRPDDLIREFQTGTPRRVLDMYEQPCPVGDA